MYTQTLYELSQEAERLLQLSRQQLQGDAANLLI